MPIAKIQNFFKCLDVLLTNLYEYFNTEMTVINKDIALLKKKKNE